MADDEQKSTETTEEEAVSETGESPESTTDAPADTPAGSEKRASDAPPAAARAVDTGKGGRKLSRAQLLSRLLEKNETILSLNAENRTYQTEIAELKDRWMRTAAEFENYRKRSRKEWELLKQQSKSEVILEILNVVDDFERAFSVAEKADSDEFVEGIRLIYNNLRQILENLGIREIDALHQPFDPNFHMAVGQIDSDDAESGAVAEVVQKGFSLDDTVIRPARVIVAK